MFAPLGALGALGRGGVEGYTQDAPLIFEQMGLQALGRAFQPQQGPIDQLNYGRGPQPPMPGQMSLPAQPAQPQMPPPQGPLGEGFQQYIPTEGRAAGQPRGSPGGLPTQAREAPALQLTRERILNELDTTRGLRQLFDANTTAEVGTDPTARRMYQAATIDRAVQNGKTLAETIRDPNYYPASTQGATARGRGAGLDVDPATFEGANFANYATGNASGNVGFAGGPQTGSAPNRERFGIEGQPGVAYARSVGYEGPDRTPIGSRGPTGGGPSFSPEGFPQLDLQTMAARIMQRSPDLAPQAMFYALKHASPMLNVEAKHQLAQLALQQKYDALDSRERIAELMDQTRNRIAVGRQEGANARLEFTTQAKRDMANLSAQTRMNIEDAKNGRAELSASTRREIATLNSDTRMEISNATQAGRTADRESRESMASPDVVAIRKFVEENPNASAKEIADFRQTLRAQGGAAGPVAGRTPTGAAVSKYIADNPNASAEDIMSFAHSQDKVSATQIKQENTIKQFDQVHGTIDDALKDITKAYKGGVSVTGLAGRALRLGEIAGNIAGWSDQTVANAFQQKIEILKTQIPRMLTGVSISNKDERARMDKIVAGLSAGDTTQITVGDLLYLQKILKERRPGEIQGKKPATAPAPSKVTAPASNDGWSVQRVD